MFNNSKHCRTMGQSTFQILEKAIISNDINTFRSSLQTTNSFPSNYQDYELLIKALRLGRKRITNLLLKKGCRVTKPTGAQSITPLHIAVTKVGWSSVVLKLIARGARVEVCDDNGDTPVHAAFLSNAAGSVIDFLLKLYMKKTLVDAVNKDGLGLLHIACTRPNLDVIRALVDTGGSNIFSQVTLQTNSPYAGWWPLHFAVSNGRNKIVKSLCEYEAEVGVVNGQGSTPLHLAVHRRDVKMIDTLMHYADWNVNYADSCGISHFMAVCAGSDPEIVRQFLRIATDTSPETLINTISAKVKDIDECPFAGYTPMHFAAEFGRLGTVQLLIDRDVHCTLSSQKLSPLDLARKRSHETISTLLETHCGECKVCKKFGPDAEKKAVFAHVDGNQTDGKPQIFRFNSTDSGSREPSIDECCMLNIFPLPVDQKHDCELCKLQEIFSIDNSKNQFREDECNEVKTQKVDKRKRGGICSRRVRSKFCEYVSNEHSVKIFIAVAACIYIVVCIVFISKYKFTKDE